MCYDKMTNDKNKKDNNLPFINNTFKDLNKRPFFSSLYFTYLAIYSFINSKLTITIFVNNELF